LAREKNFPPAFDSDDGSDLAGASPDAAYHLDPHRLHLAHRPHRQKIEETKIAQKIAGALVMWALTAWSPRKGRLGAMKV
jgi:hypothetical protein